MSLDPHEKKDGGPLPPLATAIVLGVWISAMLILAFLVVPIAFASCTPR